MNAHDMYGNAIYPLGETGYGVSMALQSRHGHPKLPLFTFFHISDGFRQSLFSVEMEGSQARTLNAFPDRILELLASSPHGRSDE